VSDVIVDESEFPALASLILADVLIPERKLWSTISRTTLWKMKRDGLPSYRVKHLGVCIRPSELKEYLGRTATVTSWSESSTES